MNINSVIEELQDYANKEYESLSDDIELIDSYQVEFLDGYIDLIIKKYNSYDIYDVYISIKSIDNIVSPLLYKRYNSLNEAKTYYEKLKKIINSNNEKNIINHCKIRE